MCPSFDPGDPAFDEVRYWRGPVWSVINFLIALGLEDAGEDGLADRIRGDTRALMERGGFAECYSALDARPTGGVAFSWTAAIWLAWLSPHLEQLKRTG